MNIKKSGILLHISSLNNNTGIGTLGKCAYDFVDFLNDSNQKYWQILPFGHTSYGDSPYQTYSVYAGNPYFIDLEFLVDDKLLLPNEIIYNSNLNVDYGFLYNTRFKVLKTAYSRFDKSDIKYIDFLDNNNWVKDYGLFMKIKELHNYQPLNQWDIKYKLRDTNTINQLLINNKDDIEFWYFVQYKFFQQWHNLKNYANKKGIEIIGDIPIYVPYDSVEVWVNPKNFMLDNNMNMIYLSGAPADKFAPNGQVWGSPLYNYEYMKQSNYSWWIDRFLFSSKVFDLIRIDHFLGFDRFYAVDAKTKDARNGKWIEAPGFEIFSILTNYINSDRIIAEDLGNITENAKRLLEYTGFYSMKILQFGLYGDESNMYFPKNYPLQSVCYTGTHDNYTLKEWLNNLTNNQKEYIQRFTNSDDLDKQIDYLIHLLFMSKSKIVIIPLQDYLHLGPEGRMNEPGKSSGNWTWRVRKEEIDRKLSLKICNFNSDN